MSPAPQIIYLVRHGEKPDAAANPPTTGIDSVGTPNEHSLVPRGWQRSGALGIGFTLPHPGPLAVPDRILCPDYGHNSEHRCHQTVAALADRCHVSIENPFPVGQETELAKTILNPNNGAAPTTVLVCWEHHRIPAITGALPISADAVVPQSWDDGRFDLIWRLNLDLAAADPRYSFSELHQHLLPNDPP